MFSDYIIEEKESPKKQKEKQNSLFESEGIVLESKIKKKSSSSGGRTSNKKELEKQAANAILVKSIQNEVLNDMKIQSEKIAYMKKAGEVAELSFMDALYFSFMEQTNLSLIKMVKRLKIKIESFVIEKNADGVVECVEKEVTNVLKGVKLQQKEELKKWKESLNM